MDEDGIYSFSCSACLIYNRTGEIYRVDALRNEKRTYIAINPPPVDPVRCGRGVVGERARP